MALLPIISANPPPTLGPFAQEIYKHSPDCLQINILVLSGTVAQSNIEEYGHMAHPTHLLFLSYLLSHTGELYRLWHAGPALHAYCVYPIPGPYGRGLTRNSSHTYVYRVYIIDVE